MGSFSKCSKMLLYDPAISVPRFVPKRVETFSWKSLCTCSEQPHWLTINKKQKQSEGMSNTNGYAATGSSPLRPVSWMVKEFTRIGTVSRAGFQNLLQGARAFRTASSRLLVLQRPYSLRGAPVTAASLLGWVSSHGATNFPKQVIRISEWSWGANYTPAFRLALGLSQCPGVTLHTDNIQPMDRKQSHASADLGCSVHEICRH